MHNFLNKLAATKMLTCIARIGFQELASVSLEQEAKLLGVTHVN